MTNFRNLNLEPFSNINDLYLAYTHDPFNEEVTVPFFEMMGQLANCIAPLLPTREDEFGNLGDIYITMHKFAMKSHSSDFLSDVIELICREFDKPAAGKAA